MERLDAPTLHKFKVVCGYLFAEFSYPNRIAQLVPVVEIISVLLHFSIQVNNQIANDLANTLSKVISPFFCTHKLLGILENFLRQRIIFQDDTDNIQE